MAAVRKARGLDDLEPAPASEAPAKKKPAKKAGKKIAKKLAKKAPAPKSKPERVKVPDAADILRDLRAMKGVEEDDFAMFTDPLAWTSSVTEWLPTGSIAIDRLIGGGWPVGRIVEVAAWESVGKSTLLDQSIAMAQSLGSTCVLIDSEQARDEAYTRALGVDLDQLIVHKAEVIEDGFVGLDRVLAIQEAYIAKLAPKGLKPPPMLIVWDSLGGTPTRAERDGAADETHVSTAARNIKMNMRRLAQRIANARAVLVFSNQFYEQIGGFGGLKSYGGSGVRYFTSVRLWLTKQNGLKIGDAYVGHIIQAKLKKTRVNKPRPPAQLGLIYGAGIHNAWTLWEWGKKNGVAPPEAKPGHTWVSQAGGWSYLIQPDGTYDAFQRTFLGFADALGARPDTYARMVKDYMAEEVSGFGGDDD